uniref:Uncharacterized protein n=1 Tax=Romanomermis culicivorax TaxID=13658 RepID=A0A915IHU9_ROMCU
MNVQTGAKHSHICESCHQTKKAEVETSKSNPELEVGFSKCKTKQDFTEDKSLKNKEKMIEQKIQHFDTKWGALTGFHGPNSLGLIRPGTTSSRPRRQSHPFSSHNTTNLIPVLAKSDEFFTST